MSEAKAAGSILTVLTAEQLRAIVADAVRDALSIQRANDGYLDTEQAAAYLGTSTRSLQHAVTRGAIVPDHRGSRHGGLKGNRFTRATLDAFITRRAG